LKQTAYVHFVGSHSASVHWHHVDLPLKDIALFVHVKSLHLE
jgi:hypothetical protein